MARVEAERLFRRSDTIMAQSRPHAYLSAKIRMGDVYVGIYRALGALLGRSKAIQPQYRAQ
jgi:hypothetical protein